MKTNFLKSIVLICLSNILISCHGNLEEKNTAKTIKKNALTYGDRKKRLQDRNEITPFPFGPQLLLSKFPKKGWILADEGGDESDAIYEKRFDTISGILGKINFSKNIKAPIIKKIEYINVLDDSLIIRHIANVEDDFKYRLPNLGPYECFYQCHGPEKAGQIISKDNRQFVGVFGNLVLYNKQTLTAKFLNVENTYSYGAESNFMGPTRLFCIEKNGMIDIYISDGDEVTIRLTHTQKIIVTQDGQVLVNNLKL